MSGPRYSITPGRYVYDQRVQKKSTHALIMMLMGSKTDSDGWCYFRKKHHERLAEQFGVERETVVRAISDLIKWGYLEKRTEAEQGETLWFYRVKMDHDTPRETLLDEAKKSSKTEGKSCDPQITDSSSGSQDCDPQITKRSPDHKNCDPQITDIYIDKRPPLNDPLSLKEGEGFENIFEDLSQNPNHARVVKHFLQPMLVALAPEKHHGLQFFETLCENLSKFSDGALDAAAKRLIVSRVKFPSVKICFEVCTEEQPKFTLIISAKDNPNEWRAWITHHRMTGQTQTARCMENLVYDRTQVPTLYPVIQKSEAAE